MRVNDQVLPLSTRTLALRRSNESAQLYIPAAPTLKILKAFAVVDVSKHQFEIQFAKASL